MKVGEGCSACLMCLDECSLNAISVKIRTGGYGGAFIDSEKCVDCGACVTVCPMECIKE